MTRNETARTEAEKARTDAEAELAQYTSPSWPPWGESTGSLTAEREKLTGELSENAAAAPGGREGRRPA